MLDCWMKEIAVVSCHDVFRLHDKVGRTLVLVRQTFGWRRSKASLGMVSLALQDMVG